MLKRSFVYFCAFWAVIVSPMLCMGGIISHACGSHEDHPGRSVAACGEADCACDEAAEPCSHEGDCASDPCRLDVTVRESHDESIDLAVTYDCPMVMLSAFTSLTSSACQAFSSEPPDEGEPAETHHPIVLPLLI
ncbi:MAG: hypothetical protein H6818_22040 [Phycisphaerales bacterium]|nr:hypothetical protein [Phycisphaerales bacterium]MCB9862473.1 hypothetical protein [Phycisphaerales bacterium]